MTEKHTEGLDEKYTEGLDLDNPSILLSLFASSTWGPGEASKLTRLVDIVWAEFRKSWLVKSIIITAVGMIISFVAIQKTMVDALFVVSIGTILSGFVLIIFFVLIYAYVFYKKFRHR